MQFHSTRTRYYYINDPMGFEMPYSNASKLDIENMEAKYNALEDKGRGLCKRLTGTIYGNLKSRRNI